MEGTNSGGSNSPAPFLLKTYEMVDDHLTNSVVSWSYTGSSFVVWNPPEFARDLLPRYFKHNNFSSFIRQLNTYGFRKIDPDQWEFANEEFIQGQRHLLKNIHRRKPIHSHSSQGNTVPLPDSEKEELERKIDRLKQEKDFLHSELERQQHANQGYAHHLRSLGQTLQRIDQRQRGLVVTLAGLLQKPDYESNCHNKKRRLLALQYLHDEENRDVDFHEKKSGPLSLPLLNLEVVEKLDASLTYWEKFLDHGVDKIHSETPERSPSPSQDYQSSPELPPSSSTKDEQVKDQEHNGAVAANDIFWQQFLTDTPVPAATNFELSRSIRTAQYSLLGSM